MGEFELLELVSVSSESFDSVADLLVEVVFLLVDDPVVEGLSVTVGVLLLVNTDFEVFSLLLVSSSVS